MQCNLLLLFVLVTASIPARVPKPHGRPLCMDKRADAQMQIGVIVTHRLLDSIL